MSRAYQPSLPALGRPIGRMLDPTARPPRPVLFRQGPVVQIRYLKPNGGKLAEQTLFGPPRTEAMRDILRHLDRRPNAVRVAGHALGVAVTDTEGAVLAVVEEGLTEAQALQALKNLGQELPL